MVVEDHIKTAWEFLEASARMFTDGDDVQASEKLWGAAAHAVMAVAQERGWAFSKHGAMNAAVGRLDNDHPELSLRPGFAVAEKFHANFYHDFMESFQIESDRPLVGRFVENVLSLRGR